MTAGMVKRWFLILALLIGQAAAQLEALAPASLVEAPPAVGEAEPPAASAAPAPSDPTDAALMNQLSQQLRNPAWLANPGQPCGGSWQGVSCSEAGRVTSISLAAYSQLGAIPEYLSGLMGLLNLTLSSMQMNGTLPTSWGTAFRQLQWLDLSGNSEHFLCRTDVGTCCISVCSQLCWLVAALIGNSKLQFGQRLVLSVCSVPTARLRPAAVDCSGNGKAACVAQMWMRPGGVCPAVMPTARLCQLQRLAPSSSSGCYLWWKSCLQLASAEPAMQLAAWGRCAVSGSLS